MSPSESPGHTRASLGQSLVGIPETETELCLSVSCGGMGQQWPAAGAGARGAVDLGMDSPLGGGHH